MNNMKLTKMISEEQIQKRINELGSELTEKLKGKDVLAICVLNGSFMFYSDLIRAIDMDITCEFMTLSSYDGMQSSGEIKITKDLQRTVKDKHVVIIEDIIDSGLTMNFLQNYLKLKAPASITTCCFLHKPEAKKADYEVEYKAFEIANDFVVGYGLDFDGQFRNLPYVAKVENNNYLN